MPGIVVIAGTEQKSKRIAQAIHQSMNFRISATSGYAYCLIPRFFPHHLRFDAPCRKLSRSRYSQSQRRLTKPERSLRIHPCPAISESGCILFAMNHTALEVPSTVPLLWQSTVSHSLHCGYHILPGVRVSLASDALAAAYP